MEFTIIGWLQAAQLAQATDDFHAGQDLSEARLDSIAAEAVYQEPGRFLEIYERHHEAIFRYLARRTDNRELALDLTSQAFVQALEYLRRQPAQALHLRPWLYQIATRVHLTYERSQRRWMNRIPLMGSYLEQHTLAASAQTDIHHKSALLQMLIRLPEKYRTPVMLRYFEGLPYKEIALATGEKEATSRSQVHRGLEQLRQLLEANDAH